MNSQGARGRYALGARWADIAGGLIVLIVAVAIVTGHYRDQRDITRSLDAIGARAYRNHQDAIYAVTINDKRIDGDVLANVARLRSVESLSLSRSVLSSGQAQHLSKMKSLRSLSMHDTNISSYDLGYIGECRSIEVLSLDGSPIGDSGIASLSELRNLKYLSLARTDVGDDCVKTFLRLGDLIELDLRSTNVSTAAIEQLRRQMPDCQITTDVPRRTLLARYRPKRFATPPLEPSPIAAFDSL